VAKQKHACHSHAENGRESGRFLHGNPYSWGFSLWGARRICLTHRAAPGEGKKPLKNPNDRFIDIPAPNRYN